MNTATIERKAKNTLAKYDKFHEDDITLLISAKKGLKPEAVFEFLSVSGLTNVEVEKLLGRTIKTFNNYKTNNTILDAATSEKLIKLFELYNKGVEVFGVLDEFKEWMRLPAFGLGEQIPESLLDTITGIELIYEELVRIEYGDLA